MFEKSLFDNKNLNNPNWRFVFIIFFIGLFLRMVVFVGPHYEGDELIYTTLVSQLENGNGYTLQKSFLLEQNLIDKNQYDKPIFFHPPGGIALFWIFFKIFGNWGFPFVQLFSYIIFFLSMMLFAKVLGLIKSRIGIIIVSCLSAFSPIMAHVTTKYWLDGPLLSFTTLSAALFLWAAQQNRYKWVIVSGIFLGYASLIKITAVLVIPGVLLLYFALLNPQKQNIVKHLQIFFLFLFPAFIIQIPWEIWQWIQLGSPFPGWAGKPSESLIANNRYIFYLTVVRSPWIYLKLLPNIFWTLIPSCLFLILMWNKITLRWIATSMIIWISIVVIFHVAVGFIGYSKVLRYIILITPASILLFSLMMVEFIEIIRKNFYNNIFPKIALIISSIAFLLEISTGMYISVNYNRDLILPLSGNL